MNVSRQDYIDYCNGAISKKRSDAIQQFLKDNPLEKKALEGAVEFSKTGNIESLLSKIDSKLDHFEEDTTTKPKSTKARILPIRTMISLASVAAVGLIFFLFLPRNTTAPYSIDQYFDKYPDVLTDVVRGTATDELDQSIQTGMAAYNTDNFEKAIQHLEAIPENTQDYQTTRFYTAISHLANQSPEKSFQILNQLSQSNSFIYADGVQWYLALSYLELNQKEKAIPILNQISESDHYKSAQAKQIIMH